MNNEEKTIIEVQGVKLEVDLRHAKRIDKFKIGDAVKVLVKEYSDQRVYPGVIVGFENFKDLPTIVVCYLSKYNSELKFNFFNAQSKDFDITASHDSYIAIEKGDVVENMDRAIIKKEEELADLKRKKQYFLKHFDKYFSLPE